MTVKGERRAFSTAHRDKRTRVEAEGEGEQDGRLRAVHIKVEMLISVVCVNICNCIGP